MYRVDESQLELLDIYTSNVRRNEKQNITLCNNDYMYLVPKANPLREFGYQRVSTSSVLLQCPGHLAKRLHSWLD